MAIIFKILHDFFTMKNSVIYIVCLIGYLFIIKYARYIKVYTFGDLKPHKEDDWEVKFKKIVGVVGSIVTIACIIGNLYKAIMMNL